MVKHCKFMRSCDEYREVKDICKYGGYRCEYYRERINGRNKRKVLHELIAIRDRIHKNCVRLTPGVSKAHFMEMASEAYDMWKDEGMDIYSEYHFQKGDPNVRGDLIGANEEEIDAVEILKSETRTMFNEKIKTYPPEIRFRAKKVN